MFVLLTLPTLVQLRRAWPKQDRSIYHLLKGGWDDPNCAHPTSGVCVARCASKGIVPATRSFFSILF